MPLAGRWSDLVIGVDVHLELVPGSPAPIPFPHPFVAPVFDPAAALMAELLARTPVGANRGSGPVRIGGALAMRAADPVRMPVPHVFLPPGTMWGAIPPGSDAKLMFGSATVSMGGHRPVRTGEVAMSCSDPVRLPTATVLATPPPRPVLVGGPPMLDTGATPSSGRPPSSVPPRTSWSGDSASAEVPLRLGRARDIVPKRACVLTGHPVNVANGCVMTDAADLDLVDCVAFERTYCSNWAGRDGPLGPGWSHPFEARLWTEPHALVFRTEDGREVEFARPLLRTGEHRTHRLEGCTLTRLASDRWEIRYANETTLTFSGTGPAVLVERSKPGTPTIEVAYDGSGQPAELRFGVSGGTYRLEYEATARHGVRRLVALWGSVPGADTMRRLVQFTYDAGNLCEVRSVPGPGTRYAYDENLLVTETDPHGASFHYRYDGCGRTARCVETWGIDPGDPEQPVHHQRIDYDRRGGKTFVTDGLGHTTIYGFDRALRLARVTDPLGHADSYERNADHRVTRHTDALGRSTEIRYDELGRETERIGPDGQVIVFHDAAPRPPELNLPVPGTPAGESTSYAALGRLRTRSRGDQQIEYRYDAEGRLVGISDAEGREARFERDARGDIIAHTEFDGRVTHFERDPVRRIRQVTRPSGARVQYDYDAHGRVVAAAHGDTESRYTYRSDGALREAAADSVVTRFECNQRGRVVAEHGDQGDVEIQRDAAGRVIVLRGPEDARVEFVRDDAGKLGKVVARLGPTRWEATRTYDNEGRLLDMQLPGGLRSYWWRDASGWPTQHFVGTDERALRLRRYRWGALGHLERLETEDGVVLTPRYDRWGRSIAESETSVVVALDDDGRVVERRAEGRTQRFQWNDADQLVAVEDGDGSRSVATCDAFGRRTARVDDGNTTRWLWAGDAPLLQWNPDSDSPILWVFDPDTLAPLARLYRDRAWSIVSDHRHAPVCVLDDQGDLAWAAAVNRLGGGTSTGDAGLCPWRLCGQFEDPSGLRYNRWRTLDPLTGRYLSPDPLGLRAGLDVYAYADDPWTQADPRGLLPCAGAPPPGGDPTASLDLDPRPRSFEAGLRARGSGFRG